MSLKKQKEIADNFSNSVGVMVSWCEGCDVWAIHCPNCNKKHCSGGCSCGYDVFLDRQSWRLNKLMEINNEC